MLHFMQIKVFYTFQSITDIFLFLEANDYANGLIPTDAEPIHT